MLLESLFRLYVEFLIAGVRSLIKTFELVLVSQLRSVFFELVATCAQGNLQIRVVAVP